MDKRYIKAPKLEALTDIWAFADLIKFKGGSKNFGVIHKKLSGFITAPQLSPLCVGGKEYNRRRLVEMPRGHLKSTIGSVLYVLWRIYRNPNIRILYGTNLKELSEGFIRELRQYLEDEELMKYIWNDRPHIRGRLIPMLDGQQVRSRKRTEYDAQEESEASDKKIKWTGSAIQVLRSEKYKEPTVLATSVGTRVTGHHYDLLILDDIVDFNNTASVIKMDSLFEWAQDMESVLDPAREVKIGSHRSSTLKEVVGDEVLILGTRYAAEDYYEYLEKNQKDLEYKVFKRNIYINGVDASGGYIWKDKFNERTVDLLKKRLTTKRWASQYLNKVMSSFERSLNMDLIKFFKSELIEKKDGYVEVRVPGEFNKRKVRPVLVVDPAISQSKTADNTAITVGGIDEERNFYILDASVGKYTPLETTKRIYDYCEKWGLYSVCVENNGVGASLPHTIKSAFKNKRPLVVKDFRMKGDKKTRIENVLQPLLNNGKFFMSDYLASNDIISGEFNTFPELKGKDDFLDTISMLDSLARPTRQTRYGKATAEPRIFNTKWGGRR